MSGSPKKSGKHYYTEVNFPLYGGQKIGVLENMNFLKIEKIMKLVFFLKTAFILDLLVLESGSFTKWVGRLKSVTQGIMSLT